jgi:hypothetical protein
MIADLLLILLVLAALFIPIGLQWLLLMVLQDRMGRRSSSRTLTRMGRQCRDACVRFSASRTV